MYPFQTTGHPCLTFTKLGTSVCFIPELENVIWNMRLTSPRSQRPEHGEGLLSRGPPVTHTCSPREVVSCKPW